MKPLLLCCLLSLLYSCVSIPDGAPRYSPAPEAITGSGTLYIYRVGAYPSKRTPDIYIDGYMLFEPPELAYTWVHINEGKHTFKLDWMGDTGAPDLDYDFEITAGHDHYIRISGSYEYGLLEYMFESRLTFLEKEHAETELKICCRYISNNIVNNPLNGDGDKAAAH